MCVCCTATVDGSNEASCFETGNLKISPSLGEPAHVPTDIATTPICGVGALGPLGEVGVRNVAGIDLRTQEECSMHAYWAVGVVDVDQIAAGDGVLHGGLLKARRGHLDVINGFIGVLGADAEIVDSEGKTALMIAAKNGHTDTVKRPRGQAEAADRGGWTALTYADDRRHMDTFDALIHGASHRQSCGSMWNPAVDDLRQATWLSQRGHLNRVAPFWPVRPLCTTPIDLFICSYHLGGGTGTDASGARDGKPFRVSTSFQSVFVDESGSLGAPTVP